MVFSCLFFMLDFLKYDLFKFQVAGHFSTVINKFKCQTAQEHKQSYIILWKVNLDYNWFIIKPNKITLLYSDIKTMNNSLINSYNHLEFLMKNIVTTQDW